MDNRVAQVSQFQFSGLRPTTGAAGMNATKESFQIKNKIFVNHSVERENQQRQFSAKVEGKVGSTNLYESNQKREQQRLSQLRDAQNDSVSPKQEGGKGLVKSSNAHAKSAGQMPTYHSTVSKTNNWTNAKDPNDPRVIAATAAAQKARRRDIPVDELIPTVEQGLEADIRTAALFNPDHEMHIQVQKFKANLENCNQLQESIVQLEERLGSRGLSRKKPVSAIPRAISYNDVFNHLKSSIKDFKMMKSRDIANHIQYKLTRKKQDPMVAKKMSTFELNTIIQKANDYDQREGPRLREKELNEQIEMPLKDMKFEERVQMYDGLDILEEIKLKKMKISKEHLRRIEKKEIERAEHDARLAYHYYKLRNHVDDGNLEKYLKRLNIGLDGKNDQGRIQFKKSVVKKNNQSTGIDSQSAAFFQNKAIHATEPEKKSKERGFVGHYENLMKLKKEIIDPREIPEVNLSGYIVEKNPDINEWANSRLYVAQPKLTFEELMEQNDRRVKEEFQQSRNNQVLSIEEQMMKYAQEFKEKEKQRDDLRKRVEGYVKDGTKILDEFLKQEMLNIDKRYDPTHCMNEYIKLMREDKLPKRVPASALKKAP